MKPEDRRQKTEGRRQKLTADRRRLSARPAGFTLIELLTVIAIIAILAGLLFPTIRSALQKAEITQAKTEIKSIEAAIRAYYTEYGKLPVKTADQGVADKYYGISGDFQYNIMYTLWASNAQDNANHVLNPRRIQFLEPPSRKGALITTGTLSGTFVDPWNQVYYIELDNNYDNQVEYYGTHSLAAVVVSYGPDRVQTNPAASGSDDIVNYR